MIICAKGNCLASGTVTKKGGEMAYIGEKRTPKYTFSIQIESKKGEDGQWHSKFLDCSMFGKKADNAPALSGGEMVLCAGKLSTRQWEGREGDVKTSTVLECDFVSVASNVAQNAAHGKVVKEPQGFQEVEEDEDLDENSLPF